MISFFDESSRPVRWRRARLSLAAAVLLAVATPYFSDVVAALGANTDLTATWNQWRGPQRDGRVEGADWPADLSGLEPLWRVELGKGYSGPILTSDRVFAVETVRKARKTLARVRTLRRDTGEEIWRRSWPARGDVPFFAESHGEWERSTPAYDGRVLYVGDMEEVLHALDGDTGEELWSIDLPAHYDVGRPSFGFASSPLLLGGHLYVQAANGLVKIDTRSGKPVWRTAHTADSIMTGGAFSSPVVAELHGVRQILVFTRASLNGIDPQSGRVLWQQEIPNFRGMNIVTPVVYDDGIFVSQYRNGSFFLRPGVETPLGEGSVDPPLYRVKTAWTNKGSGYMSSPVVIGDHAYQHLGNGRVSSINLTTGDENWRTRPMGDYWSMVWQDDRILALDSEGMLRLVRATPERFDLVDEREVAASSTWGHLAVVGDTVVVRELEAISAFRWSD